jgi:hypothetical protein
MGQHASFTTAEQRLEPRLRDIIRQYLEPEPTQPTPQNPETSSSQHPQLSARDFIGLHVLLGRELTQTEQKQLRLPLDVPQAMVFDDALESELRSRVPDMPVVIIIGGYAAFFTAKLVTLEDFSAMVKNSAKLAPAGCTYRSLANIVQLSYLDTVNINLDDEQGDGEAPQAILQLHEVQAAFVNTWVRMAQTGLTESFQMDQNGRSFLVGQQNSELRAFRLELLESVGSEQIVEQYDSLQSV